MAENQDNLRLPPYNEEAEKSVLGSMMLDKQAVSAALQVLDEDSFYRPAHRNIFKAMLALEELNEPIDHISVVDEMKRQQTLDSAGGAYYITELTERIPSTANVEYYARLVMEAATLRSLIRLSADLSSEAYETREHVDELLDRAESKIFELSAKRFKTQGFRDIKPILDETFDRL